MYSITQICDRLKIDQNTFDQTIDLIEDAIDDEGNHYSCTPTYHGDERYYSEKVIGWVLQLREVLKSNFAEDFKAKEVDLEAIALFMSEKPTIPYVVPPEEVTLLDASAIPPEEFSSSIAQISTAIAAQMKQEVSPLETAAKQIKEEFALQKLLQDAVTNSYQLSSENIASLTGKTPNKKLKIGDDWKYGVYRFKYLGGRKWMPRKEGDLRIPLP